MLMTQNIEYVKERVSWILLLFNSSVKIFYLYKPKGILNITFSSHFIRSRFPNLCACEASAL